jgi:hypothetical protein
VLGQTRVALEFPTALTIDAYPLECGRVLQDEDNYRFRYESALICDDHNTRLASEWAMSLLWGSRPGF